MDKPNEIPEMPVLTDAEHTLLRAMEGLLRDQLRTCTSGHSLHDADAAFQYLRTGAVKFYDFAQKKYSQHPNRPHSVEASSRFAYQRISKCLDNFSAFENFLFRDERIERLKKTISEHAAINEPRLIKPFTEYPKIHAIGDTTDSPLLKMAKAVKFIDPVASKRQAVIQPILDDKGWSIYDWAQKAKVSHHTASDYFTNKRKTQPYNRKKLSDALSLQFQQFPK